MGTQLVRRYGRGQANQGEVLDNCCHVASALVSSAPKVMLLHLETRSAAAGMILIGKLAFRSLVGWLDNLSSKSNGGNELGKAMEGYSWWGWSLPCTKVILKLISLKTLLSKQACWPVGYGEIRIIKKRSFVLNLDRFYSRDAQYY